ncbi:MAG: thiamine phosphate synthase [Candidatus Omnitrophica bacterium]|nr:thiamine phosphate synthase [Candidatus Omnitrophota bacterium]
MKSRKHLLKKSQLYLILDKPTLGRRSLENIYSAAWAGKIGLIQLRDKQGIKSDVLDLAIKLSRCLSRSKTLFIVNDYIDIAVASGADGLHLGQDDLPVKEARKILGQDKIIGISCHNLAQALKAQREGANYIGIGPVYSTATKPEYKPIGLRVLQQLKDKIKIPYFAIGDIHLGNIGEVIAAGARRIAVCRAILKANNPKMAADEFYKKLNK